MGFTAKIKFGHRGHHERHHWVALQYRRSLHVEALKKKHVLAQ